MAKYDSLIDQGFITVDEAAIILNVNRITVHRFIDRGWLRIRGIFDHAFFLSECSVKELGVKRRTLLCLKCGHKWTKRWLKGNNRCHIQGCRSTKVKIVRVRHPKEYEEV